MDIETSNTYDLQYPVLVSERESCVGIFPHSAYVVIVISIVRVGVIQRHVKVSWMSKYSVQQTTQKTEYV